MNDNAHRAAEARKGSPFLTTERGRILSRPVQPVAGKDALAGRWAALSQARRQVRYHIDDIEEWSSAHGARTTAQVRPAVARH